MATVLFIKRSDIVKNSIIDELLTIAMIIGGLFIGFSKLKEEDEMISKIRYDCLGGQTGYGKDRICSILS